MSYRQVWRVHCERPVCPVTFDSTGDIPTLIEDSTAEGWVHGPKMGGGTLHLCPDHAPVGLSVFDG